MSPAVMEVFESAKSDQADEVLVTDQASTKAGTDSEAASVAERIAGMPNVESRDQGQSVSAETPRDPVVVNTGGNKAGKTSTTAESREALRVAKTEAVQAARELAKHKAAAQKDIKTVMKAQFNLKKVATPKNIKLCNNAEKTLILCIKKDIAACEKACSAVIKGKSPEDIRL